MCRGPAPSRVRRLLLARGSRGSGFLSPSFCPAEPFGGVHVDGAVGVVGPVRDEPPLRLFREPTRHLLIRRDWSEIAALRNDLPVSERVSNPVDLIMERD